MLSDMVSSLALVVKVGGSDLARDAFDQISCKNGYLAPLGAGMEKMAKCRPCDTLACWQVEEHTDVSMVFRVWQRYVIQN